MPQVVPTHINAHKARRDELRAEGARLNGEADQLEEYINAVEGSQEAEKADEPEQTGEAPASEDKPESEEKPAAKKPAAKGKK